MNDVSVFSFGESAVRTVEKNGEVWFVAKDVADILEYSETNRMTTRLDDDEFMSTKLEGMNMNSTIINESGLYNAIIGSNKPEAKVFKKWVTSEVLPSIRKVGGYMVSTANDTDEDIMARAYLIATNTLKQRDERIKALENKMTEQLPMVEFAETVIASENSEKIGDYAKSLSKMYYVTIGPNKLFQWLRENKYLMVGRDASERNKPYQKHIENGLFEIKYEVSAKGKVLVPYITGKGQFQLSKIIVEYFSK
jgi:anti-repressor protein